MENHFTYKEFAACSVGCALLNNNSTCEGKGGDTLRLWSDDFENILAAASFEMVMMMIGVDLIHRSSI